VKVVLCKLVEELAQKCLKAFGNVDKFGMGGMLQVSFDDYDQLDAQETYV
jgi:hypothetical protein